MSKKEAKKLILALEPMGLSIPEDGIEVDQRKGEECYYYKGKPYIYHGDRIIPTIYLLNDLKPERMVLKVDEGAVPHVINGANVFAQGIVYIDPGVKEGDIVFVANTSGSFIAVGVAVRSAEGIMRDRKGTAVKIIHHPGDRIMQTFT
ncbi:MAG: DUF1947 domain-containing protein [Thermoplasmataceae archaeon]